MNICNLCGGEFTNPIFKNMLQCKICGVFKREIISENTIKKELKKLLLSDCHKPESKKRRIEMANNQLDMIEKYKNASKIFDVGTASGLFLKIAQDRGWEVDGNEISVSAIEYGKKNFNIDIRYGFLEELDLKNDNYDVVVLWHTLEHTTNPKITIDIVKKILKKDGYLYIGVPEKGTIELLKKYYERGHTYEFSRENLTNFLINNDFDIIECIGEPNKNGIPCLEYMAKNIK